MRLGTCRAPWPRHQVAPQSCQLASQPSPSLTDIALAEMPVSGCTCEAAAQAGTGQRRVALHGGSHRGGSKRVRQRSRRARSSLPHQVIGSLHPQEWLWQPGRHPPASARGARSGGSSARPRRAACRPAGGREAGGGGSLHLAWLHRRHGSGGLCAAACSASLHSAAHLLGAAAAGRRRVAHRLLGAGGGALAGKRGGHRRRRLQPEAGEL